uniref:Uncharacterized protein n=1 Tax=Globodera rostochiensis TaxID=31243 RepID=A0A914H5A5_GLORO
MRNRPYIAYNYFTFSKCEAEMITGGLITFNGPQNRGWNLLAFSCWIFLVYVSLFGYVAQFIYRYLLLNWDKKLSTFKYFILSISSRILALNITDHIPLTGHSFNDWKQTMGFYYIIIACTVAYMIIITLAFLMDKLLNERLKLGASSALTVKMVEMNKQISRNLIIQASMPFFIYLSILFLLGIVLFKIDIDFTRDHRIRSNRFANELYTYTDRPVKTDTMYQQLMFAAASPNANAAASLNADGDELGFQMQRLQALPFWRAES